MQINKKKVIFFILIFLLVFIDFFFFLLIFLILKNGEKIVVIPNLIEIILFFNNGGVFGLGNNVLYVRLFLIFIRFLILFSLTINSKNVLIRNIFYQISFILAYAGCIGNFIDILFYWEKIVGFDGVIDWIKIPFFDYVFNLADAYVSLSIVFLILNFFKRND